jgi:hypothetical protein
LYIECSENCPCGKKCSNRRFQTRGTADFANTLKVKPFPGRGFGLEASKSIPKDAFVMEYRGEVISLETSLKRNQTIYKFSKHHYFLNYGYNEVIDGHQKGTIARFANHSCDPSCRIEKWKVDGEYRYGVFARRTIKPGDEITYDYKFQSFGPMQKCLCGSRNCRGYIGVKSTTSLSPAKVIESTKKMIQRGKKPIGTPDIHSHSSCQVSISAPSTITHVKSNRSIRAENRQGQKEESPIFSLIQYVHKDIEEHDGTYLITFKGSLVLKENYDCVAALTFFKDWKKYGVNHFLRRNLHACDRIPGLQKSRESTTSKGLQIILEGLKCAAVEREKENMVPIAGSKRLIHK